VAELLAAWPDGRIKLFLTACGLRLRRSDPDLFLQGTYVPLDAEVTVTAGVVAFARVLDERALITIVPRLSASVSSLEHPFPVGPECWKTSRVLLPPELGSRRYRNVLTGQYVEPTRTATQSWIFVGEALRVLPVGVLVGGSRLSE
jgi:(1->4)-alpha-D-glucan 1-alpha-D-glucosylmutase